MVRLNEGKGAQALVLTKMIRLQQPVPDDSNGHQTIVILVDKFENQKGKTCYHIKDPHSNENNPLLSAWAHFVKVEREGEPSLFLTSLLICKLAILYNLRPSGELGYKQNAF